MEIDKGISTCMDDIYFNRKEKGKGTNLFKIEGKTLEILMDSKWKNNLKHVLFQTLKLYFQFHLAFLCNFVNISSSIRNLTPLKIEHYHFIFLAQGKSKSH